jgi:hypothetical protein
MLLPARSSLLNASHSFTISGTTLRITAYNSRDRHCRKAIRLLATSRAGELDSHGLVKKEHCLPGAAGVQLAPTKHSHFPTSSQKLAQPWRGWAGFASTWCVRLGPEKPPLPFHEPRRNRAQPTPQNYRPHYTPIFSLCNTYGAWLGT